MATFKRPNATAFKKHIGKTCTAKVQGRNGSTTTHANCIVLSKGIKHGNYYFNRAKVLAFTVN